MDPQHIEVGAFYAHDNHPNVRYEGIWVNGIKRLRIIEDPQPADYISIRPYQSMVGKVVNQDGAPDVREPGDPGASAHSNFQFWLGFYKVSDIAPPEEVERLHTEASFQVHASHPRAEMHPDGGVRPENVLVGATYANSLYPDTHYLGVWDGTRVYLQADFHEYVNEDLESPAIWVMWTQFTHLKYIPAVTAEEIEGHILFARTSTSL